MKRLLIGLVGPMLLISVASAEVPNPGDADTAQYFQPCNSWIYSTQANGFVCSYVGISTQIPDQYEFQQLQQTVQQLQYKVQTLEQRVQQLEQQPR